MQKNKAHLLVIRFSAMGDVAMAQPVVKAVLEQNPSVEITFLSTAFFEPIFQEIPNLRFYKAHLKQNHKGFFGLIRLFLALKKQKITAVADLHDVIRSNFLGLLFRLSGIKVVKIDKGRSEKKALTRPKNKVFKQLKTTHERYADVFRKLGFDITLPTKIEQKKQPPKPKKNIGIAPFAQHTTKQYPLKWMEEVVKTLSETYHIRLFGGGEKEKIVFDHWVAAYKNAENMIGKTSFSEEIKTISELDLMVSMDSGNGHLAAMNGVNLLIIWNLTHPFAGFAPFLTTTNNWLLPDRTEFPAVPTSVYGNKSLDGYENAIKQIPPKIVIEKIESLLLS